MPPVSRGLVLLPLCNVYRFFVLPSGWHLTWNELKGNRNSFGIYLWQYNFTTLMEDNAIHEKKAKFKSSINLPPIKPYNWKYVWMVITYVCLQLNTHPRGNNHTSHTMDVMHSPISSSFYPKWSQHIWAKFKAMAHMLLLSIMAEENGCVYIFWSLPNNHILWEAHCHAVQTLYSK